MRFCASSLLVVYEGDVSCDAPNVTNVKMIDFGRVRRQIGGDEGYALGLRTLKHLIAELVEEDDTPAAPLPPLAAKDAANDQG